MKYSRKVILITGASSGIGRALALKLSYHDNSIVVTGRRGQLLDSVASAIRKNGSTCESYVGDALDPEHANYVVSQTVKQFGRIDIALLNIGYGTPSNTLSATQGTILHFMRATFETMVNFFCPLILQMKQQTTKCMIAHVNSQAGYFGIPMAGSYSAAKSAARVFLETARMELEHFGIDHVLIQTIHPGFVDTDAARGDINPKPNQISEESAAEYILAGIAKGSRENVFPPRMKFLIAIGRIVPNWLRTKALLSALPDSY